MRTSGDLIQLVPHNLGGNRHTKGGVPYNVVYGINSRPEGDEADRLSRTEWFTGTVTVGWVGENIHQATRITPKVRQKSSPIMSGKSFGVASFPTEKVGIVMNILKVVAFKFNSFSFFNGRKNSSKIFCIQNPTFK